MSPETLKYVYILVFMLGGGVLAGGGLITAAFLSPRRPDPIKTMTYECGQDPVGNAWVQYNVRYYLFAMVFVLFDVEVVFVAPWAVGFRELLRTPGLGGIVLLEMVVFMFFLILALAYAWRKGILEWT